MQTVTLSPKFQVVIPADIRQAMGLQAGTQWVVSQQGKGLTLMPVPSLAELKAELKGCGANLPAEPDRF